MAPQRPGSSPRGLAPRRGSYLRPQLSADVVGVQGEQRLPRPDVQDALVLGQGQRAVVEHALDAEPRHAVQHVCGETERPRYGWDQRNISRLTKVLFPPVFPPSVSLRSRTFLPSCGRIPKRTIFLISRLSRLLEIWLAGLKKVNFHQK